MRLKDRAAIVTGAASGIGAATVEALRAAGVTDFALVDRTPLTADALVATHDVADEAAWAEERRPYLIY